MGKRSNRSDASDLSRTTVIRSMDVLSDDDPYLADGVLGSAAPLALFYGYLYQCLLSCGGDWKGHEGEIYIASGFLV